MVYDIAQPLADDAVRSLMTDEMLVAIIQLKQPKEYTSTDIQK